MRRQFKITAIVAATFMMICVITGAEVYQTKVVERNRNCRGYTVIEFDKGIDCQGDTVSLVKKNGYFELASK